MASAMALETEYDFVIVGGGTSGSLLSSRLATALPSASVLLVEAGRAAEDDEDNLVPGLTKGKYGSESGNWLYETLGQEELVDGMGRRGRVVPYPRGKGVGGCSANNFMAWVRGPKADWDDWAEAVGDEWWKWENAKGVMNKLEDFREGVPDGKEDFARPSVGAHGKGGPFAVGYGTTWQPIIEHCLAAGQQAGHEINADNNDGDPVGISVAQFNVDNGVRRTAATAFLDAESRDALPNLTIVTSTICSKILFEGKKVSGVELIPTVQNGIDEPTLIGVREEVILTAGCFQSPQLLLLSGIGPAKHLAEMGIPLVQDLPVGRNLQDHSALACEFIIHPSIAGHNQLLNDPRALAVATEEYKASKTGPLAVFGASAAIIFPRLPGVLQSREFARLPATTQEFMESTGRPSTEIWMHSGPLFYTGPCPPDASVMVIEGLCQNNLSRGSLELSSANPRDLPSINPRYLSHEHDVRIAVETVREILKLAATEAFSSIIQAPLLAPLKPDSRSQLAAFDGSDDDIIERFVRQTLTQGFHSMSTCVMGRDNDKDRVVGSDFRVAGVQGLRVADMSACPVLTSNHTQINAYLIGERCTESILQDRGARRGRGDVQEGVELAS